MAVCKGALRELEVDAAQNKVKVVLSCPILGYTHTRETTWDDLASIEATITNFNAYIEAASGES